MGMTLLLLLLIAAFTVIFVWAFGRKRKDRFTKDARIPFDKDSDQAQPDQRKE